MTKQICTVTTCAAALMVMSLAQPVLADGNEFESPLVACLSNGTAIGASIPAGKSGS